MRTHVTLDSMGALVEGVHENPFELLGPHPVEQDGRTALAVRAYLPDKQQAWVLDRGPPRFAPDASDSPGWSLRGDMPDAGRSGRAVHVPSGQTMMAK